MRQQPDRRVDERAVDPILYRGGKGWLGGRSRTSTLIHQNNLYKRPRHGHRNNLCSVARIDTSFGNRQYAYSLFRWLRMGTMATKAPAEPGPLILVAGA